MTWKYKVGFSLEDAAPFFGSHVHHDDIVYALTQNGFAYSYDTPRKVISDSIPTLIGSAYKNPSVMQKDAPLAFSCSSLISYLATLSGLPWMPSITVDKYIFLREIPVEDIQFGDLIFSNSGEGKIHYTSIEWRHGTLVEEGVDHVGMYLGDGKVLHASKTISGTYIQDVDKAVSFTHVVGYRRMGNMDEKRYCVTIPEGRTDIYTMHNLLQYLAHGEKPGYKKYVHKVPYISQLTDIQDLYWTNRACGGVCLAMALRYFKKEFTSLEELCYSAEENGYFTQSFGWYHQGLIDIARTFGLHGYRTEGGIVDDVVWELQKGNLVILSVAKQLFGIRRPHLVLAVGYATTHDGELQGVYTYDPESLYPQSHPQFISKPLLRKDWNGKYIVIGENT
jgi:cell wall-associated NlpC family hydrolase